VTVDVDLLMWFGRRVIEGPSLATTNPVMRSQPVLFINGDQTRGLCVSARLLLFKQWQEGREGERGLVSLASLSSIDRVGELGS